MLKSIPKSSVSRRAFPVYKQWEVTNADYQIISASLESGLFDTGSSNKQGNIYTTPLYRSIKAKFYNTGSATVFNTFGRYENLFNLKNERKFSDIIYILKLPQSKYGEEIKPGSIRFISDGLDYSDDGMGNITSDIPRYIITLLDFETEEIIIVDNDGNEFIGTLLETPAIAADLQSGEFKVIFNGDDDTIQIVSIDLQENILTTARELNFTGLEINELVFGNIFYDEGLFVFITPINSNYNLNYRSTKTIYETEVLVSARAGEFNYSQNPSAIDVILSGSYSYGVTSLTNQIVGTESKKYKVVESKTRKEYFTGSLGYTSGSWEDYFEYKTTDPTGSYLAPYITTIGLYDNDGDMVAIAKLPTPIKNLPDYDMNFIVRLDT
jgi:hypothetical protein